MMPITVSVTGVLNLQSAAFALLFMFLASISEAGGLDPLTIITVCHLLSELSFKKYK